MVGSYSVQFHDKNGVKPMRKKTFENFDSLFEFVSGFRATESSDAINVHLPSRATRDERRRMREGGYISN